MSPRAGAGHLDVVLALLQIHVPDLERLAPVAHVQLRAGRDAALVYAHKAQLADVGVDADLEHVRQHVRRRVGLGVHQRGGVAFAVQEVGRVALGRVGQQAGDHIQQFRHAGARAGRDKTDRDQVPLAQRLLQRRVQLVGVDVAVVQVAVDKVAIDLDHLLDQRAVRIGHGAKVAVALAVVKAIDHLGGAGIRQVQGQAFLAEGGLDVGQHSGQIDVLRVDPVDDDEAVQPALGGVGHHALGHRLDAGGGVDDDGGGFHRFQRRQALADEIGRAGRVDQVDAAAAVIEVHHRRLQRMPGLDLQRVVVADGAAALHAAGSAHGAGVLQQGLGQRGLAGGGGANQGQGSDVPDGRRGRCGVGHGVTPDNDWRCWAGRCDAGDTWA